MKLKWLANAVSIIRIVLVLFYFVLFYLQLPANILFILALIIIISDKLDGTLARRLNAETKIGAVLDSIADISLILGSWIIFYITGYFGIEIFLALIAPRVLMGISFVIHRIKYKYWNVAHYWPGKIGGLSHFIALLWILGRFPFISAVLLIAIIINWIGAFLSEFQRHREARPT